MTKTTGTPAAAMPDDLRFEDAYARLEAVLARLQTGNMPLDDALTAYEEGMLLAARCQELLEAAELRVEQLEQADDGTFGTPHIFMDDGDEINDEEPPF